MLSPCSAHTKLFEFKNLNCGLSREAVFILLVVSQLAGLVRAEEQVDYGKHVKSILLERCYACHGALKQESSLRLDTVASMVAGGDNGSVVAPGLPQESILVERIREADDSLRMPPEGTPLTESQILQIEAWIKAGAIPPAEDHPQADPLQHWAFRPPVRPILPPGVIMASENSALGDRYLENPIDQLLSAKHRQLGIEPMPEESYRTLVRRLYVDLIGIPPTPEQMADALTDLSQGTSLRRTSSPDAYERLVEKLLSQTEYGERWGRHWMDVWRYSDWYGRRSVPDVMNSYPQIWRWRDWIIRSLNEDKGYDQMLMEMLAADELLPGDDTNIVATGFLVRNWYKWNYETWMKDNVEHTGKALLGLTLNCAHCHDHKYDPISQEDYFRFRAFFEPLELRHDRIAGEADPGPFKKYVYAESYGPISSGAIRVFDEKLDAKTYLYSGGDARNRVEGAEPLSAEPPLALKGNHFAINSVELPVEAYYPGLKEFVRQEERGKVEAELVKAQSGLLQANQTLAKASSQTDDLRFLASQPLTASSRPSEEAWKEAEQSLGLASMDRKIATAGLSVAQARRHSLQSRIAADDARYRGLGDPISMAVHAHSAEKQLAFEVAQLAEMEAQRALMVASHKVRQSSESGVEAARQEESKVLQTLQAARSAVDSALSGLSSHDSSYIPLSPIYPSTSTGRRLALARWIASELNPLTARVAVNHIWLRHFGQALVDTTDNFGLQGSPPKHQEILDWLAVELMENGWSMKHIHRLIVTSQAYRRSSNPPLEHAGLSIDSDNSCYWRFVPRRMEAEVVRDSVLACAGTLDETLGGPEIENSQWSTSCRRSIYFTIHGESKMQFLDTFDGPNVCDCYRRSATVMPQQALALTNSELLVSNGRKLASKIAEELKLDLEGSIPSETAFVEKVFETVLCRPPSERELQTSIAFLEEQVNILSRATEGELSAAIQPGVFSASSDKAQRARENLAISLFSHNDFVTVR